MSEMEVPIEHLHETIKEKAHESKDGWTMRIALSTALMAVIAALAGLLAEHSANEALISQIKASDQWAYYQAKGIKYEINASTLEILAAQKIVLQAERAKNVERYKHQQEEIKAKAEELEKDTASNLVRHSKFSRSITLFQIAIAISAVAILTRKKSLWIGSLCLSISGIFFLIQGLL